MEYGDDIVISTGNAHKLEEIGAILKDLDYNIHSLKDVNLDNLEIEENGKTFEHNALIKARTVAKLTNMITIADDSGLEVDAIAKNQVFIHLDMLEKMLQMLKIEKNY